MTSWGENVASLVDRKHSRRPHLTYLCGAGAGAKVLIWGGSEGCGLSFGGRCAAFFPDLESSRNCLWGGGKGSSLVDRKHRLHCHLRYATLRRANGALHCASCPYIGGSKGPPTVKQKHSDILQHSCDTMVRMLLTPLCKSLTGPIPLPACTRK